jgi:hypothetical protein
MIAYTLKKRKDTEEYHLFEGIFIEENKCNTHLTKKSICGEMDKTQNEKNIFECKNEQEARELSAKLGRKVCGTCISHLYETKE